MLTAKLLAYCSRKMRKRQARIPPASLLPLSGCLISTTAIRPTPTSITAVYVRHPKPQREYTLPEGYLELLEQKRYSPSTIKTYRAYFSDFMEYHKGRNIDRLKVADINKYILYLVNEKKISVSQQNMRINAIKFYYEQVKGGKRQYYGGITRAKEYKSLPEVLTP